MSSLAFGHASRAVSLSRAKKSSSGHQRHRAQVAVGDDHRVRVDRVRRVRHEHAVARLQDGQREMRHALLGADGRDDLRSRDRARRRSGRGTTWSSPRRSRVMPLRGRVAVVLRIAAPPRPACRRCASASAWSGLPMPRSMMSSPRARAFVLRSLTMAKTYGRQALDPVEVVHVRGLLGGVDDMRSRSGLSTIRGDRAHLPEFDTEGKSR